MNKNVANVGILFMPSVRSIAYLNVFKTLNVLPTEIILLEGNISNLDRLKEEGDKYNYTEIFFDVNLTLDEFLQNTDIKIYKANTSDINSEEVIDLVKKSESEYFVFTGGGILSEQLLNQGKKFIHAHPGLVPEFRGSTCFYYSILENGTLGCTLMIMDKNIDTGPIITSAKFFINYFVNQDQPLFIDYILDPFIRSITLKKFLSSFILDKIIRFEHQRHLDVNAYFIMHPALRHLAIKKLNNVFNPKAPIGVVEINNQA